jgi:hypothetical protein
VFAAKGVSRQRMQGMDRSTEILAAALAEALSGSAERRLYRGGKLDGLFPSRSGAGGEAAGRALRDGLLEVVRTETRGRTIIEWVRPTPAGVEFLYQHQSPVRALDEMRSALRLNQQALPVWLADMRAALHALDQRLGSDAARWHDRLEALARRVEQTLDRLERAAPPLPADVLEAFPWAIDAINYLDRRRSSGTPADCPLPELFAALRREYPELSLGGFHQGLDRLHERHVLRLRPVGATEAMPQPEYALLRGDAVLYYVTR